MEVSEYHIQKIAEKLKVGNKASATLDKFGHTSGKVKAFLKYQYKLAEL